MKWVLSSLSKDCGAACLATVALHYGARVRLAVLIALAETNRQGARLDKLRDAAIQIGFNASCGHIRDGALDEIPLPAIVHLHRPQGDHYIVLYKRGKRKFTIVDPSFGEIHMNRTSFLKEFSGFVLLLKPNGPKLLVPKELSGLHPLLLTVRVVCEHRAIFVASLLTAVLATAGSLALPFFLKRLIDSSTLGAAVPRQVKVGFDLFLVVAIARSVLTLLKVICTGVLSRDIEGTHLSRFVEKLPKLPLLFFDNALPADIIARVSDASSLRTAIAGPILSVIADLCFILAASVILLTVSGTLFLTVFAFTSLGLLIYAGFRSRQIVASRVFRFVSTELTSLVLEITSGIRLVKSVAQEDKATERISTQHRSALISLQRQNLLFGCSASIGVLLNGVAMALIMLQAEHLVALHEITAGQLTYVLTVAAIIMGSSESIASSLTSVEEAAFSIERLKLIDPLDVGYLRDGKLPDQGGRGPALIWTNVSFGYRREVNALERVSFAIERGEVVGIQGESGCGKSTLAMICNGLYPPNHGDVEILGRSLFDWNLPALRRAVLILFSEGNLASGSVYDNISLGAPDVIEGAVTKAAVFASADTFIRDLPGAYDYRLGPGGFGLSTGQRQRLALARAFLIRPQILILDEATSNLDVETERTVLRHLISERHGLTTILISHRPETMKFATTRYEMKRGHLEEADKEPAEISDLLAARRDPAPLSS